MPTLPIKLKPYPDELLSSWFIRTSLANGSDPEGFAWAVWDKWRAWTRDFDRAMPEDKLRQLSKVSGMPVEVLKEMTLQSTIEKVLHKNDLNSKQAWAWVVSTGNRNRTRINGLHFCPQCLKEKPVYFRKSWRFAWNTICPEHKILLAIACPICNTVISPHLTTYQKTCLIKCTTCEYDLTLISGMTAENDVLNLQFLLNDIILDQRDSMNYPLGILEDQELFETLHFLLAFLHTGYRRLEPILDLFKELGINVDEISFSHSKGSAFEKYPVLERYHLMLGTSRLLALSKKELIELLVRVGITKQMFNLRIKRSNTIEDIYQELFDNRRKTGAKAVNQEIKPRSKIEVDLLMDEIKQFL